MRTIPLTQGKVALVDDEDFEYLNQWKWHLLAGGYAARTQYLGGGRRGEKKKMIYMHALLNKTPTGFVTDHINGNKLDNRKENLRTATSSQNGINRGKQINNTSGHKGINWYANAWVAEIKVNQKKIHLGRFKNIDDAVAARKAAEQIYHTF